MPGLSGLVLLALCLNLHTCRVLPGQLPALGPAPPGRAPGPPRGCGPCEAALCPQTRGCRAGLVPEPCGCCSECGNLEGQSCDPGLRSGSYGLCGTGMRCQADPRGGGGGGGGGGAGAGGGGGGGEEEEQQQEAMCVCDQQEALCGSDDVTYMNMCQFREAAFSRPDLQTRGEGPCRTAPVIKVPPLSQVRGRGSSLLLLCEVFAFPMATVEWRREGRDLVLPGDDAHISVQSRGGPLKFEVSSWLQIEGAEPEDSGTYRCVARNNVGSVSASAVLGVLGAEELSSYLANSVSEMNQLMDASDYDQDVY